MTIQVPEYIFNTTKDLRNWLHANHNQKTGIWVVFTKKSAGGTFGQSEIVDELLCYGWIDSVGNKINDSYTKLYIAPRNPKSNWSRINKDKVARLLAENKIQPSGMTMIELAKKTGTWNALNDVDNLVIPKDLQIAFDAIKGSLEQWNNFSNSTKKGILEWILHAKKEETRAVRVAQTANLASKGIAANQYIKKN